MQDRVLDVIIKQPSAGRKEIASILDDITEDGVKYHLEKLKQNNIIKRIGPDKGGKWKVL